MRTWIHRLKLISNNLGLGVMAITVNNPQALQLESGSLKRCRCSMNPGPSGDLAAEGEALGRPEAVTLQELLQTEFVVMSFGAYAVGSQCR